MRMKILTTLALACCFVPLAATAATPNVEQLEQMLVQASASGGDFEFIQQSKATDGQTAKAIGHLSFLKPDLFRIAYSQPEQIEIISNGNQMWVHDSELNQVFVSKSKEVPGAQGFLAVLASGELEVDLTKRVEISPKDKLTWLVLIPDQPQKYNFLECAIYFTPDGEIAKARFIDLYGTEVTADFRLIASGNLEPRDFEFEIPSGAEVIHE